MPKGVYKRVKTVKHSDVTKLKMSISAKKHIHTQEHNKNVSISLTGRKISKETRKKISKNLKGKTAWNKGLKTGGKYLNCGFQKGHKINLGKTKDDIQPHAWIERKLGKPNYCEHCKRSDKSLYEWSNKDHKYRRAISDWQRLCRSCHMKFDFKYNNRTKPKYNQYQLAKIKKYAKQSGI